MLTGDHAARGKVIGRQLDVNVEAELMPAQKVAAIEQARRRLGPVAMVGDGINDAPALSASDVGIALGCGTDLSRDSASICLLGDDLSRIPWTIELARRTRRVIRWNLFWAFGYNGLGVACAAMGWLNPALAAFLMVASGILVTGNSLRLGRPFEVDVDADDVPATSPRPSRSAPPPCSINPSRPEPRSRRGTPLPWRSATDDRAPAHFSRWFAGLGPLRGHVWRICPQHRAWLAWIRVQPAPTTGLHGWQNLHLFVFRNRCRLRRTLDRRAGRAFGSTSRPLCRSWRACC